MEKINWGIIGLGDIANKFSEGFNETSNAKLLSISSKNSQKLNDFQRKFNIEKKYCFNNYEDLINCSEVDIVYIALPNSLHHFWVLKCIQNQKHVLVEKPATLNYQEIKDIDKSLKNKNLFFGEAFMYRYLPHINLVLNIIKNQEIGNIVSMNSYFGINILTKKKFFFYNKKRNINPNNRLFNKDLGGGCILDLGCYPISLSILIASLTNNLKETDIKVLDIKKELGETNVDIEAYAKLLFNDSFFSQIGTSFKNQLGGISEIIGDKGSIKINSSWFGGDKVIKTIKGNNYIIDSNTNKNIYSYQIENISKNLSLNIFQPQYPGMSLKETLLNMYIIDEWLNV